MKHIAMGVDVGGSHISCVAVDLRAQALITESRAGRAVDNQAPAETILDGWAAALGDSLAKIDRTRLAGIGFAMPGPFDYAGGIALFTTEVAKYQKLHGINISNCLRERLEKLGLPAPLDLRYLNDATAFGVGEAWLGEASNMSRSISITLGTGLGSSFVADGIPVVDGDLVPWTGALWHLPFRQDIADASFSTRWFLNRYAHLTGSRLSGVRELADRAATDPQAREVFLEFGRNLADFLGPWIRKFAADVLVLGGNVSGAYHLFRNSFEAALTEQQIAAAVRVTKLKEDAATIGSARLFDEQFWNRVKPLLRKM